MFVKVKIQKDPEPAKNPLMAVVQKHTVSNKDEYNLLIKRAAFAYILLDKSIIFMERTIEPEWLLYELPDSLPLPMIEEILSECEILSWSQKDTDYDFEEYQSYTNLTYEKLATNSTLIKIFPFQEIEDINFTIYLTKKFMDSSITYIFKNIKFYANRFIEIVKTYETHLSDLEMNSIPLNLMFTDDGLYKTMMDLERVKKDDLFNLISIINSINKLASSIEAFERWLIAFKHYILLLPGEDENSFNTFCDILLIMYATNKPIYGIINKHKIDK